MTNLKPVPPLDAVGHAFVTNVSLPTSVPKQAHARTSLFNNVASHETLIHVKRGRAK